MKPEFYTIGVFNSTKEEFFEKPARFYDIMKRDVIKLKTSMADEERDREEIVGKEESIYQNN